MHAGPLANRPDCKNAGHGRSGCRCAPACGSLRTGRGGPQSPSACSVKPNKDGQQRPPSGILKAHPLLWNAGRDTGKLAGFGCRARLSAAPLFYPSMPRLSSLQYVARRNTPASRNPSPADASGEPCRPAGRRPDPGRAGASDSMARTTLPKCKLSQGVYRN